MDTYLLGTCTGSVTVNATADAFADLDIKLSLLDAAGQLVASADVPSGQTSESVASNMSASVTQSLASGTYYASVDGVGNGPWSTGYDDYGSLGAYTLGATGCNGVAPTGTPSAPTSTTAAAHASDPTVTVTWAAPASAGSSAVTGYILTRSGSDTPVQVGPTTTSNVWTGLESGTAYSFTVTALNAQGPGPSVTATATTVSAAPSVPQNVTGSWDSLGQRALFGWSAPVSSGGTAVSSYSIFVDGVHTYNVVAAGTYIIPMTPGTHVMGVAAVNSLGRGPVAQTSIVMPARPANDAFAQRTTLAGVSGTDRRQQPRVVRRVRRARTDGHPRQPRRCLALVLLDGGGGRAGHPEHHLSVSPTATPRSTSTPAPRSPGSHGSSATTSRVAPPTSPPCRSPPPPARPTRSRVNGYRTFATGVGAFSLSWAGTAPPPAAVTTTTLAPVVTGRSATLTATVTAPAGTPAGNVEFRDNGVLVGTQAVASGSRLASSLSDLVKGDHPYRATFVPTDSALFTTSQSSIVTSTIVATHDHDHPDGHRRREHRQPRFRRHSLGRYRDGHRPVQGGRHLRGQRIVSGGNASLALTGVTPATTPTPRPSCPSDTQRYDGSTSPSKTATVTAPPVAKVTTTGLTATPTGRSVSLTASVTATSGTPEGTVQFRDGSTRRRHRDPRHRYCLDDGERPPPRHAPLHGGVRPHRPVGVRPVPVERPASGHRRNTDQPRP